MEAPVSGSKVRTNLEGHISYEVCVYMVYGEDI